MGCHHEPYKNFLFILESLYYALVSNETYGRSEPKKAKVLVSDYWLDWWASEITILEKDKTCVWEYLISSVETLCSPNS